ncbi:MAG: ISL3 family transposase [Armatimonadota bacterium]
MKNVASATSATLLPCLPGVEVTFIASTSIGIELQLTTTSPIVACPLCGQVARRVHSRYRRALADLPWNRVAVRILLHPRKLFCDNAQCKRRIFTEPLPQFVAPYARKTLQLQEALYLIVYALGGKAGARVTVELGLTASADTLLRRVRQVAARHPNATAEAGLSAVGVDDFAFRRGSRYGTILVDLKSRRLVDLLPDRSSESLAAWLKRYPSIEVISRDRAAVYAEGASAGAPQAIQVADRWHLLRNLGEAMERLTAQHSPLFRQVVQMAQIKEASAQSPDAPDPLVAAIATEMLEPSEKVSRVEQLRLDRCARREAVYHQVKELRAQGGSLGFIAEQTGISTRTVQRFLATAQFPERARRRSQRCLTDAYQSYLRERLLSGYTNVAQLYREIKAEGYSGTYSSVYAFASHITGGSRIPRSVVRGKTGPQVRSAGTGKREVPPSRDVAWWLQGHLTTGKLEVTEQQQAFLQAVFEQAPVLKEASELAKGFVSLLKQHAVDDLTGWLESAIQSGCNEIRSFAQGINQDLAAVRKAVSLSWSNGQTEGQVNRLKMVKRQMFGRAKFDLLRARVMPMPQRMAA